MPAPPDDDGPQIIISRQLCADLMTLLTSSAIEPQRWDYALKLHERLRQSTPIDLPAVQQWLRVGSVRRW